MTEAPGARVAVTVTPALQVPLVGLVGVAAGVHSAADVVDQTVSVVAAASAALPEARVKAALSDWLCVLVVLVVFVMVTLPVATSEVLLVAVMSSLPNVVVVKFEMLSVAATCGVKVNVPDASAAL